MSDPITLDKLHEAFKKLTDEHNILAPHESAGHCGGCSSVKIFCSVMEGNCKGAVFYHDRTLRECARTGQLRLEHGSADQSLRVSRLVQGELLAAGAIVEWSGSMNDNIVVHVCNVEAPPERQKSEMHDKGVGSRLAMVLVAQASEGSVSPEFWEVPQNPLRNLSSYPLSGREN